MNHCEKVCNLIISHYKEARNKELGEYEEPSSSSSTYYYVLFIE